MQHNAVGTVKGGRRLGVRGFVQLLRTPRWLLGLVVIAGGIVAHVSALGLAPLSIVQPIGALALPVTVLLHFRTNDAKLRPSVILAVLTTVAGLAIFVVSATGAATPTLVGAHAEITAALLAGGALCVVGIACALTRGTVRSVVLAVGAGIAYGYVSLQMRASVLGLEAGGLAGFPVLPLLALLMALALGVVLLQLAYATGPPDVAVACLTVVDPLVAVGFGIGLLGEAAHSGGLSIAGEVAGAVIACLGVVMVTRHRLIPRREAKRLQQSSEA